MTWYKACYGREFWQDVDDFLLVLLRNPKMPIQGEGEGRHAWALFTAVETDDISIDGLAWTADAGWAWLEAYANEEGRDVCDMDVSPCLLLAEHVVFANSFGVKTHEDLERVFAEALPDLRALGFSGEEE